MQVFERRGAILRLLGVVFAALTITLVLGACGNSKSASDPTATSATGLTVASDSTTVPVSPSSTGSSQGATTLTSSAPTSSLSATTTAGAPTTTGRTTTTAGPTTTAVKGEVALKVSGPSGVRELTIADLKAVSATSGYGGWKNQLGNITGPTSWKGVSVQSLMKLVGGGGSVTVVASDGYTQTLSADQLAGSVTLYDPATGDTITSISGSVQAIVAYAKAGSALGSSEGPLRIAFVGPEKDQVTDSDMWVRQVIELKAN